MGAKLLIRNKEITKMKFSYRTQEDNNIKIKKFH